MRLLIDIEANGLENPDQIWLIVCKDIDTKQFNIFRNLTQDEKEKERFKEYISRARFVCGHNLLGYDWPHIERLLQVTNPLSCVQRDTLILSKLLDYSRPGGHSLEQYGLEFGFPKISFNDFSKYSKEMEEYCVRDVEITERIYHKFHRFLINPDWQPSIELEHQFQGVVNALHSNGFYFNVQSAGKLLDRVTQELEELDAEILRAYPRRLKLVREVVPRATKFGTINRSSIPKVMRDALDNDLSCFTPDAPFSLCKWEDFNPSSHKQLIEILTEAKWRPEEKTQTHIDTERELNRLKYTRNKSPELDLRISELYNKLQQLRVTGWKINENNLNTLPDSAPSSARLLAKRILLESRRRTLTEWLSLVSPSGRIHGKFYGIGAWTHRMAHQNPNTANIPTEAKLYGKEMRQLWRAPRNRLLVGVDAEGIQLRIFAHYINDPELTRSLVEGKKSEKTDPHSLNQRVLGSVCKSRQAAKRFVYSLFLGAGIGKLASILECSQSEAEEAFNSFLRRYPGLSELRQSVLPADAERGWFRGLDGRKVKIPGDTVGTRKHLAMSGYLQNGEAVVMKKACLLWHSQLAEEDKAFIVNFVHDEWQTECPNNMETAIRIAKIQADSLRLVGEELKLNCPLAGSYWNDDHNDYTIGTNWYQTH